MVDNILSVRCISIVSNNRTFPLPEHLLPRVILSPVRAWLAREVFSTIRENNPYYVGRASNHGEDKRYNP